MYLVSEKYIISSSQSETSAVGYRKSGCRVVGWYRLENPIQWYLIRAKCFLFFTLRTPQNNGLFQTF